MSPTTPAEHARRRDPGPPEIVEVAPSVYAYLQPDGTWWINNAGFIAGPDRVTLIDTCSTEARTRALLAAVSDASPNPIATIVNTHHHGDHTNGNGLAATPGATTIVAHHDCRTILAEEGIVHYDGVWEPVDWGELPLGLPTTTFADRLTLWSGDRRIELRHPGVAHTTNDVVAWLPDDGVLFTGDLVFHGGTPFILMGSVQGALESVEFLRSFEATTVVPGHGPLCGPDVFDVHERYFRFVLDLAAQAHAAGTPALEAARAADLGEFAELSDPERLVGNLHRALAELSGTERGGAIDLVTAIGEMISFNGGRPLACCA